MLTSIMQKLTNCRMQPDAKQNNCGSKNIAKMLNKTIWNPFWLFNENVSTNKYAVLILNTPLGGCMYSKILLNIWNNACVRITVDGGTNHWLSWINEHAKNNCKNPDLITGDMDSIEEESLAYFTKRGVTIINTPDQNETDFTKALRELRKHATNNDIEIDSIVVVVNTSGRFDHVVANINTLFKVSYMWPDCEIFNLGNGSLTWLLEGGQHQISIPERLRVSSEWCALMPIGSKCLVTTSGLKWNLDKSELEFGKLVSTSNTYGNEEFVFVETDRSIVWSMGVESLFL